MAERSEEYEAMYLPHFAERDDTTYDFMGGAAVFMESPPVKVRPIYKAR